MCQRPMQGYSSLDTLPGDVCAAVCAENSPFLEPNPDDFISVASLTRPAFFLPWPSGIPTRPPSPTHLNVASATAICVLGASVRSVPITATSMVFEVAAPAALPLAASVAVVRGWCEKRLLCRSETCGDQTEVR